MTINTMTIHKTAVIDENAQIAEGVEIGPYAVIGPNVKIGRGTKVGAHAIVDGFTTIGEECRIFAGASVGLEPQDLSYKDEPTGVIMGARVTVREYATIHRGTKDGFTKVGDECFIMNHAHVAHDCQLGRGVIMANSAILAGHVQVGDYTVFGGICVAHQHCRIGRMVMISGMSGARVDLPPFSTVAGIPITWRAVNNVGMKRQKFGLETRMRIKQAYKFIYYSELNVSQALEKIEQEIEPCAEITEIVDFYRSSKRGVVPCLGEEADAEISW